METQEEIIIRLGELLQLPVEETMREVADLKSSFYKLNQQKLEQQKQEHRDIGAKMEDFIPVGNPLEETFKGLFSKYRDSKAKYLHTKEEAEQKNLSEKQEVLSGLKELIDNEENIGKSFDRFKDFQDRWKAVGRVPKEAAADLNKAYKAEVDRFYYNISINKELKEYDLAKNLEIRTAIVVKLEELQAAEKIKDIELILGAAKEEWEDAGPVKPEVFGDLRTRYYEAVRGLHKKIQDFYSERKEQMAANLTLKKQLVERVLALAEPDHGTVGKWNKATDQVLKLRDEWKTVGLTERKQHNAVWEEFKAAQDAFFSKKKDFLGEARESFKENKQTKEKLIGKADALRESTDWRETTEKLKRIQQDWKKVGSAGPRDDGRLWKRFRETCDTFFNNKKEFFDTLDDRQAANLQLKEQLLEKMNGTKLDGSKDEGLSAIKVFGDEWAAIDHVPKKDIKRIAAAYDKAVSKLYAQLKMDQAEVDEIRFQNKVTRLSKGDEAADQLKREEQFLERRMREKREELLKYENNMAFFKHAKPDNPLLINAQEKIGELQSELEALNDNLKTLKVTRRKLA